MSEIIVRCLPVESSNNCMSAVSPYVILIVRLFRCILLRMRTDNLYKLPESISAPVDDGACNHLLGLKIPHVLLPSTGNRLVDLAAVSKQRAVVYCYPRTGTPDEEALGGTDNWNAIPGARGCTPQSCAFRDHFGELQLLETQVFGLSSQTTEYQQEMVRRLHLPFEILSDADLAFTKAINLPTFEVTGVVLIKRLTLIIVDGKIIKFFYPVFPPDKDAEEVVTWLKNRRTNY